MILCTSTTSKSIKPFLYLRVLMAKEGKWKCWEKISSCFILSHRHSTTISIVMLLKKDTKTWISVKSAMKVIILKTTSATKINLISLKFKKKLLKSSNLSRNLSKLFKKKIKLLFKNNKVWWLLQLEKFYQSHHWELFPLSLNSFLFYLMTFGTISSIKLNIHNLFCFLLKKLM